MPKSPVICKTIYLIHQTRPSQADSTEHVRFVC